MDDLITTKQLQGLLQIDRTTVYRMLKDGRLTGVKVGNQWRFPRNEVDAILSGVTSTGSFTQPQTDSSSQALSSPQALSPTQAFSTEIIPLNCIQAIQNVFAEVANVGSVTTVPNGEPLTEISNCCRFCDLIVNSESGRQACIASWRKLAKQPEHQPHFVSCHAGLQYARARIEINDKLEAMLIAGQFYAAQPEANEEKTRIEQLANKHNLDVETLKEAAQNLPILDSHKQSRIGAWLEDVAHTFEEIGHERAEMISRLQHIAEMSRLDFA